MLSLYEILKASKTGIAPDMWTALAGKNWGGADSGAEVKELTGILPLGFKADGTPLLDYLISGNMSQSGTPTPTTPIQPQETGERTGNLADLYGVNKTSINLTFRTVDNMKIVIDGKKSNGSNIVSIKTPNISIPAGTYTAKIKMVDGHIENMPETAYGVFFGINQNTYSQRTTPGVLNIGDVGTRTFILSKDTVISSFDITPGYGNSTNGPIFNNATFECWFYAGTGNEPYEPYGYKIPISSANTTTPVYLGEVETTRKVKKLVFDGTETGWRKGSTFFFNQELSPDYLRVRDSITCICSHYQAYQQVGSGSNVPEGYCSLYYAPEVQRFYIKDCNFATLEDFTTYLAAQYAAGTPVTIWYVLATETTGIVNETIRKIGTYADTLSYEQAGVSVPTLHGNTVIDVETTLKPSEMYIKYQE